MVGVLLGQRGYDTLGDIVDDLGFGDRGWAYIFNPEGTIMAHPDSELVLNGVNVFDQSGPLAAVGEALASSSLSDHRGDPLPNQ